MRIVLGVIGILIGVLMLKYTLPFRTWVGTWSWAEKWFGTGGTYTGIKMVGILAIILSFIYMTGTLDMWVRILFGRFIPGGVSFSGSLAQFG